MFIYNSNFSVNKSIDDVFKLIYEVPDDYSPEIPKEAVSLNKNSNREDNKEDKEDNKEDKEDNQEDEDDKDDDNDTKDLPVAMDMKNAGNINENLYKILEWNINNNWDIINGKRRKIENCYIYVKDFPDYLKEVLEEDDSFIRLRRKHTIVRDGEKYKEIIANNKITNLKLGYLYIMKALCSLKIVKIREKVSIAYINDTETKVNICVKVNIPIIINDELEKYLKVVFESILNNIKNKVVS
jgi:hypothetical protein